MIFILIFIIFKHVLFSVLDEEVTEHSTFETIANSFQSLTSNCEPFTIGLSLATLLQHHDLIPKQTQKLTALYLLFELYCQEAITNNPFINVFTQILVSDDDLGTNNNC